MSKSGKLNRRQEQFCREYLIDLNATQAAIRAGYSPKTAGIIAQQLFIKTYIQQRIAELMAEREKATQLSGEKAVRELADRVFFDPGAIYDDNGEMKPFHKWPLACRRMVKSFDLIQTEDGERITKIRWNDSGKYMELLCRHFGLLKDRVEVSANDVTLRGLIEMAMRADGELDGEPPAGGLE